MINVLDTLGLQDKKEKNEDYKRKEEVTPFSLKFNIDWLIVLTISLSGNKPENIITNKTVKTACIPNQIHIIGLK